MDRGVYALKAIARSGVARFRSSRMSQYPSLPASPMSLTRTSGDWSSTAESPSSAVATARTFAPAIERHTSITSRESGSSSTTSSCRPRRAARSEEAPRTSESRRSRRLAVVSTRSVKGLTGSVTMNVEPSPSPSLMARTVPPCISTRWRTIASPSPSPPVCREWLESACLNRSNTYGRNAGAIPAPVSLTSSTRLPDC